MAHLLFNLVWAFVQLVLSFHEELEALANRPVLGYRRTAYRDDSFSGLFHTDRYSLQSDVYLPFLAIAFDKSPVCLNLLFLL